MNEFTYPGVYITETPSGLHTIEAVSTSITAFVGDAVGAANESGAEVSSPDAEHEGSARPEPSENDPKTINSYAEFEQEFGRYTGADKAGTCSNNSLRLAVRDFFLNGGATAVVVHARSPWDETQRTGLYALDKVDLFNLLCLPDEPPAAKSGTSEPSALAIAANYCGKRRAVLILDAPPEWDTETVTGITKRIAGFAEGMTHKNAALFFPRIGTGPNESRPACGAIAGVIARIDAQRGVWKAAAGTDAVLSGVDRLSRQLTEDDNGELNTTHVNCLRYRPSEGNVVWGARTLEATDTDWKYIPVRRTALFIEESVSRGTQWVVFEPNDEPLWAEVRQNVGNFLHVLFRQGVFPGDTPREAYFVQCDRENNTPDTVRRGELHIRVGFAPLKPAEFVILEIQQIAGQVEPGEGHG